MEEWNDGRLEWWNGGNMEEWNDDRDLGHNNATHKLLKPKR